MFFGRVAIQNSIPPSPLWAPLMDVTRLLSSLLSLFCTMISGVGGSKTLPMDQPIFSTKSIYHGYSPLCISASSKAILFSFIFLLWVYLPLCLFEAHCYVKMLGVLHYTSFCVPSPAASETDRTNPAQLTECISVHPRSEFSYGKQSSHICFNPKMESPKHM